MALHTLDELQRQFDTYTAQITAIDEEIAREPLEAARQSLMVRRYNLAKERETVAADLALQNERHDKKGQTDTPVPIEHRVSSLEREVRRLWGVIKPNPRQQTAKLLFWGMLVALWSMWMIKEIRDWLMAYPFQAVLITLALVVAALIIRWLPEDDDHD